MLKIACNEENKKRALGIILKPHQVLGRLCPQSVALAHAESVVSCSEVSLLCFCDTHGHDTQGVNRLQKSLGTEIPVKLSPSLSVYRLDEFEHVYKAQVQPKI